MELRMLLILSVKNFVQVSNLKSNEMQIRFIRVKVALKENKKKQQKFIVIVHIVT
ncbi:hypothetical protein pb186bvf_008816 [Paramecium bursaria]